MFCTKCGQQLEDSVQFCTKCGNPLNGNVTEEINIGTGEKLDVSSRSMEQIAQNYLSYVSLILSVVGVVGAIIVTASFGDKIFVPKYFLILAVFRLLITTGCILAVIALYKQKCKLALIAGLIPCVYLILAALANNLPFLKFLGKYLAF
jgi:hypothetical protein